MAKFMLFGIQGVYHGESELPVNQVKLCSLLRYNEEQRYLPDNFTMMVDGQLVTLERARDDGYAEDKGGRRK